MTQIRMATKRSSDYNDPKHDQRIFFFTLACWSQRPIHANFVINEASIQDNKLVIPIAVQRLNKSIELSHTDSNQSRLLINWKALKYIHHRQLQ